MYSKIRIACAQINCTVGDFKGNCIKILRAIGKAVDLKADMVSFPEMAVTGYPPEDLLLKERFICDNLDRFRELTKSVKDIIAVVGFIDRVAGNLYNSAGIISNGQLAGVYHKALLPNYGVFDEKRYFRPGNNPLVFRTDKIVFGVNICEDIWSDRGPVRQQAKNGAKLILNINASPYHSDKAKLRQEVVARQAKKNNVYVAYTNLVGGQDELVFDGQSFVVDDKGKVIAIAEAMKEELLVVDLNLPDSKIRGEKNVINVNYKIKRVKTRIPLKKTRQMSKAEETYNALALAVRDYVGKNGFKKAVIGLSGGIDSSLVATIAADALGRENVYGAFMPSQYSSAESRNDAFELADNLGIKIYNVSIKQIFRIYRDVLKPLFAGRENNIAEENLQARIRGNLLMALSNKFGWLVLTTGNKSEMSTGYATLYGDMAGGFAVIKDVPKTFVYKLAEYRNSLKRVIPQNVMIKAPTAELKPDQKDSDTLPEYEVLDPILEYYIEKDMDSDTIISNGFDDDTVRRVVKMVDSNEYKRRQSPPGPKITQKAFGKDRRMPITNRYNC